MNEENWFRDFKSKIAINPDDLKNFNELIELAYPEIEYQKMIENLIVDSESKRKPNRKPQETISGTLEEIRDRLTGG